MGLLLNGQPLLQTGVPFPGGPGVRRYVHINNDITDSDSYKCHIPGIYIFSFSCHCNMNVQKISEVIS